MIAAHVKIHPLPGRMSQLVYWRSIENLKPQSVRQDTDVFFVCSAVHGIRHLSGLLALLGPLGAIKTYAKLMTLHRAICLVKQDKDVLCYAWCRTGRRIPPSGIA